MRIVDYPAPRPALASTALLPIWQGGEQCAVAIDALAQFLNPGAAPTYSVPALASEAIAAGSFVNVYDNSGMFSVRNANGSDPTKFANAFALSAIASGVLGNATLFGVNSSATLPSTASEVWLSDVTPGGFLTAAPTASGSIVQPLGMVIPGYGIIFTPQTRTQL